MKRIINYGKRAESGEHSVNEVALTVTIEPSTYYNPKTKETYTKGEHFSVCGDIWNSSHTDIIQGGQCVDYIVNKFASDETSHNLRKLWEVFHLQQMEDIPERFRTTISDFVSGKTDEIIIERKQCAACLLEATETVTDYGTYTNGEIIIKTPDGMTETIQLSKLKTALPIGRTRQ